MYVQDVAERGGTRWDECPDRANRRAAARRTNVPPATGERWPNTPARRSGISASDGVRLAWAESGTGAPFVKASNLLTHLAYDLESPVWRHWVRFLAEHFHFIRYDERGCGMSDWNVGNLSLDRWIANLEQVIEAARPAGPVTLLGISQGAARASATRCATPSAWRGSSCTGPTRGASGGGTT